jgi:hypothetical protein
MRSAVNTPSKTKKAPGSAIAINFERRCCRVRAFSGEVETGSPQKMRLLKDN